MSRCFPYPPPGYEKEEKNLSISNGEGEAQEPHVELELELGYPGKNAKNKDKKEKKKKQRLEIEKRKSGKKHKHKHHKHKKANRKDKDIDQNKQNNKDNISKVLTRDKNGGHVFEDKNGVVDAKGILNKVEPEPRKFSEKIQKGNCCKIYPFESEDTMQRLHDQERKSEVESRKFAGIYGLENGKCDMIDLSDKENLKQKVDENKQLESRKSAMIRSLKNGKCNKTDLSNRKGSRQKVDKDKKLETRKFAGTVRHENRKWEKIDVLGREISRKQVDKDTKLEVESRNSAGKERLKDGKCDKTNLSDGEGSMQQVKKDKKLEVETRKSVGIERHQNGKCDEIDPSASEGSRQNMDKDTKLKVELKKCARIGRLENGKCDEIGVSVREGFTQKVDKGMTGDNDMERDQTILMDRTKSNSTGKKRKKMETTSDSHVESAERLTNGKCKKIDQLDRQGSRQKVIKETVRDNEIARDKEIFKDMAKSESIRKKRKEMDTTYPPHGNGHWIHLPVLTDKDKRPIKRPRIEPTGEVYCGNGTTAQEAKDRALGCAHENGVQDASNAAVEKCIASACHLPVAAKECEQNGKVDCKTISHAFGPSYCNAEVVDAIPSRTRADNHVQDFNYFYSVPPKLDWSHVDDLAWLFHSNGGKPKTAVKVDHTSTVWAQALHLQPNLYALPYVIHL